MIGIAMNPNSIYIPMFKTGCLKSEFDSTYSVHLNGIISPDEFRESINKINRKIPSNKSCVILLGLMMIIATPCLIFAGLLITGFSLLDPPASLIIIPGVFVIFVLSICCGFGFRNLRLKRLTRMREVISEESIKYSTRSPTPCSWRLDISKDWTKGYTSRLNIKPVHHLVIDIGRSTVSGGEMRYSNQVISDPTTSFGRQENNPPPSYSSQSARFCPRCNAQQQDLTAKFCSSCQNSFDKY